MAAATADRKTARRDPKDVERLGVAASTTIYGGTLVAKNASGYAVPASASKLLTVVGVSKEKTVGTTNGAVLCEAVKCVAVFGNSSSTDAITIADIGRFVFAVNDQTVGRTPGTSFQRPVAGRVVDVTTDGVWVSVGEAPTPYQIVKTFTFGTDVNDAALTQVIALGTPSPGSTCVGLDVLVSQAFAGPSITDVKVALGTAGDDDAILASADVDAATAGRASTRTLGIAPNAVLDELVNVKFTAVGANLSVLTGGVCTVITTWVQG